MAPLMSSMAEKSRIMIVEDERLVALALERCLRNMGYEVPLTLASGEEAVRKVVEVGPDLVLMDIRLKGVIDGVEAAGMIRAVFRVPVVYLTACSEDKVLERAKATEPLGFIMKPFEEKTLQATVETALYKASMDRTLGHTREKLQTILRCVGEGVIVMNANGIVQYLNPTAQNVLLSGNTLVPGTELAGIFKVLDGESREPALLPIDKVIAGKENAVREGLILVTGEQGRLCVDCTLAPLQEESGNVWGLVLTFCDVTEKKKLHDIVAREHRQALELQKSLLPSRGTDVGGLRAGWFLHASDFAAGDIFNVFPIDASETGLYMIDVTGHGIASAVNALILHHLLSVDGGAMPLLRADPGRPRDVAEKLSSLFISEPNAPFLCVIYATMEHEEGKVTLVRAGQPYPILLKKDGSLSILRSPARALGVTDTLLAEHQIVMDPGDRLFLYSDGLIECRNEAMERFSEEHVCAAIRKTRGLGLAEAVASIDAEVVQWRSVVDFDDDVCLLAIERA